MLIRKACPRPHLPTSSESRADSSGATIVCTAQHQYQGHHNVIPTLGAPLQCSCLENPMDGGAWWAAVHGVAELGMTEKLHFHFSLSCTGQGYGNPLQCSCLENPRDGGALWAAVYGVA